MSDQWTVLGEGGEEEGGWEREIAAIRPEVGE